MKLQSINFGKCWTCQPWCDITNP